MAENQKQRRKRSSTRRPAKHTKTFQLRIEPYLIEEAKQRAEARRPQSISASAWIREAMIAKMEAEDGKILPSPEVRAADEQVRQKLAEAAALIEKLRTNGLP